MSFNLAPVKQALIVADAEFDREALNARFTCQLAPDFTDLNYMLHASPTDVAAMHVIDGEPLFCVRNTMGRLQRPMVFSSFCGISVPNNLMRDFEKGDENERSERAALVLEEQILDFVGFSSTPICEFKKNADLMITPIIAKAGIIQTWNVGTHLIQQGQLVRVRVPRNCDRQRKTNGSIPREKVIAVFEPFNMGRIQQGLPVYCEALGVKDALQVRNPKKIDTNKAALAFGDMARYFMFIGMCMYQSASEAAAKQNGKTVDKEVLAGIKQSAINQYLVNDAAVFKDWNGQPWSRVGMKMCLGVTKNFAKGVPFIYNDTTRETKNASLNAAATFLGAVNEQVNRELSWVAGRALTPSAPGEKITIHIHSPALA